MCQEVTALNNKNSVLVCVTPQMACEQAIETAKELATKMSKNIAVITVQPKKAAADKRSKDIKTLTELASKTGIPISVHYSDNPAESVAAAAKDLGAVHIFTGAPGKTDFIAKLSAFCHDIPISIVVGKASYTVCPLSAQV